MRNCRSRKLISGRRRRKTTSVKKKKKSVHFQFEDVASTNNQEYGQYIARAIELKNDSAATAKQRKRMNRKKNHKDRKQ